MLVAVNPRQQTHHMKYQAPLLLGAFTLNLWLLSVGLAFTMCTMRIVDEKILVAVCLLKVSFKRGGKVVASVICRTKSRKGKVSGDRFSPQGSSAQCGHEVFKVQLTA